MYMYMYVYMYVYIYIYNSLQFHAIPPNLRWVDLPKATSIPSLPFLQPIRAGSVASGEPKAQHTISEFR